MRKTASRVGQIWVSTLMLSTSPHLYVRLWGNQTTNDLGLGLGASGESNLINSVSDSYGKAVVSGIKGKKALSVLDTQPALPSMITLGMALLDFHS